MFRITGEVTPAGDANPHADEYGREPVSKRKRDEEDGAAERHVRVEALCQRALEIGTLDFSADLASLDQPGKLFLRQDESIPTTQRCRRSKRF